LSFSDSRPNGKRARLWRVALKKVEEQLTTDLSRFCTAKLAEAREHTPATEDALADGDAAPSIAMVVTDANPALNTLGLNAGLGLFTLGGSLPKPMRSILDVVQAQSRRLSDVSHQLESARAALSERKAIERAKGLLMASRRLSEEDTYSLMRQTAMSHNKRIAEVAEAIVSMAGTLQASFNFSPDDALAERDHVSSPRITEVSSGHAVPTADEGYRRL
jgi:AmiR/NasT family two-component response regulator